MKNKLKILITGPVAPPAGGVSIHIQRLVYLLNEEFQIDLIDESRVKKPGIFYLRSLNIFRYFKKIIHSNVLFVQGGNKLFKKLHILSGRFLSRKVIITIHGYGKKRRQPFRSWDGFIYGLAHKIILVNPDIICKLPLPRNKCVFMHAFLPPDMNNEPSLPPVLETWINKKRNEKRIIICANASRLGIHNSEDLYGLDISIGVMDRLLKKQYPVCFVYTVSALESGADLFNKNRQLIHELSLQDHFLLISEKLSFVRLIENADIVIRPTNTDGDALTVREALYLGKPTIASDIVERPEGTILFKNRDMDDLEKKLEEQFKKITGKPTIPQPSQQIPAEDFMAFYRDLIHSVALK
jgi:glycosyltransferase involved in cell wall biosynthesis